MRLTSTVMFRAYLAFSVLAILAIAAPADAANRGIPFVLGDLAESAIQPAGDADTFVFEAFADEQLTVTLVGSKKGTLQPVLEVLDPDGAPMDLTGFTKQKGQKISLKKFPLPETGVYALRVSGAGGTEGEYSLKTKGAPVKSMKLDDVALATDGQVDVTFSAATDSLVVVKIKAAGGQFEALSVSDPSGTVVPGQAEVFRYSKKGASANLYMNGGLGIYGLALGNATAALTMDVTLKFKHAKHKKQKLMVSPLEPVVTRIDPTFGRPGAKVAVHGENFQSGNVIVLFGDLEGQFPEVDSDKMIDVSAPNGDGEVDLTVFNPDGQEGILENAWTYIAPRPTIATLDPDEGPDDRGTPVDLYGTDFTYVTTLTLDGKTLANPFTIIDEGHLQFTTDPHAPGAVTLVIGDQWGQTASRVAAFRFVPRPDFVAVDPPAGTYKGGTLVNLYGSEFRPDNRVFMDGVEVPQVTYVAKNHLQFITSAHAKGNVQLLVRDIWDRDSAIQLFEFNDGNFLDKTDDNMPSNEGGHFGANALALGDVDGDGSPDLLLGAVSPGAGTDPTRILINNGNGNFKSTGPTVPDRFDANDLALGDLDGDGDLDLVITQVGIYTRRSYYYYTYITYPISMPVYMWTYNIPSTSTRILLNDGKGVFKADKNALPDPKPRKGLDIFQGVALQLGDLDGDSDLDLVLTHNKNVASTDWSGYLYYWGSSGYYYGSYTKRFKNGYLPNMQSTRVLLNNGKASFTNATSTNMPAVSAGDMFAGDDVLLGDVDGDKDLDILLTGDNAVLRDAKKYEYVAGSKTRILTNNGKATFTNQTAALFPAATTQDDWGGTAIALGDVDADGRLDIVVGVNRTISYDSGGSPKFKSSTRVFSGQEDGTFVETTGTVMPAVDAAGRGELFKASKMVVTDHDGDGDDDLFIVDRGVVLVYNPLTGAYDKQVSSTRFLLNRGTGTLLNASAASIPSASVSGDYYLADALILGDVDGDEKKDLIVSTTMSEYLDDGKYPTRILFFE